MADPERRKLTSEVVKNYVTALAIVVGGAWALYQFSALLEREKARIEVESLRIGLETDRLSAAEARRQALLRDELKGGTLQIEIDARAEAEGDGFVVLGAVAIANISDIRVDISLDPAQSALELRRLVPRGGTVLTADAQSWQPRDHEGPIAGMTALPGRRLSIPFAFWVDRPGVYLISFEAGIAEASSVTDAALRESYGLETFAWQENRIIRVAPAPVPTPGAVPAAAE